MSKMVTNIMEIVIGAIVAAALLPTAIGQFVNTSTEGWSPAVVAVWGLISLLAVLAIGIGFMGLVNKGE
jgi:hypothetical protein